MSIRANHLTSLLYFISLNSPRLPNLKYAHALLIVSSAIAPKPISRRLVSLYCLRAIDDFVLSFFCQQVHPVGCRPSKCTFPLLVIVAKLCKSTNHGNLLHCLAMKIGFMFHVPIPNSLIHLYASFDALDHARQMFDEIPNRDTVSYNLLLGGYVKVGDLEKAEDLFSRMPEYDVKSWSILFKGYVMNQQFEKGLGFFYQMLILGVKPDEHLHTDSAIFLFEQARTNNVFLWNTLILGIGSSGWGENTLDFFTRMQVNGVKPDEQTFICLLLTCSHAGLVEEGLEYFEMMNSVYGMKPTLAHYWCLVDLFVRAGRPDYALKIVHILPWDNQSSLRDALIHLSNLGSNISIGECLSG
ncbi:pentatricopeptide repeat-containing protein [Carex littledalei]|uniref:Pentatricopeptide repeat-containing protein n=1 Tax=Carex littledalei TaxID=544730 RepID=A0A833VDT7_9POAL|nr:pentatricopeptide repeat-containing protein [Carex littledalei]